ncbi:2-oxo-4-hydroxy-4-carboxy-5-ureidoimidazoline decarboxylase [Klenkia brasiliensis]|uniref:2-oxo-4-hydroxy-4-carboxy-5-ureidoimidazoline decarboxylase n=1 Tax=Klenkia brasiliensis TaxID=333142 RepID=A0A1G7Y0D0_9ACTN|nr:2-oxo-4-hydroxy-4-carboxy-5-ureidoimidazoline decarboxylase [Klenkia brasiliensis]SDG89783.1 2-oxo-4-hydroxy-4-carboxy-5-ureidoimidazoline decarboxylase [Klenkia brasiliensis]
MDLASFNAADDDEVTTALRACNAAAPFAPAVASGRPYDSVDALVDRAGEVSRALPWDAVAQALAAHPRIGDRVSGDSAEASSSRREQASMSGADDDVREAILAGNRAYEDRFDHVFLVRAAGRTPEEMLAELRRRLAHTPDQERPEVVEQLAQITQLRVRALVPA